MPARRGAHELTRLVPRQGCPHHGVVSLCTPYAARHMTACTTSLAGRDALRTVAERSCEGMLKPERHSAHAQSPTSRSFVLSAYAYVFGTCVHRLQRAGNDASNALVSRWGDRAIAALPHHPPVYRRLTRVHIVFMYMHTCATVQRGLDGACLPKRPDQGCCFSETAATGPRTQSHARNFFHCMYIRVDHILLAQRSNEVCSPTAAAT